MIDALGIAQKVLQVVKRLHEIQRPPSLPSEEELRQLVALAFWTGLDAYEGVRLNVRLLYTPVRDQSCLLRLEPAVELTPSSIRALSPALPSGSGLVVSSGSGGVLEVHSLLCSPSSARGGQPLWLVVESRKPGSVSIRIGSRPIVEFVRGVTTEQVGMSHDQYAAMSMLMNADPDPEIPGRNLHVAGLFLDIGAEMDRRGGGGALWILAPGKRMEGDLATLGHAVGPNPDLLRSYEEMWAMQTGVITLLNSQPGPSEQWLARNEWVQWAAQDWDHLRQDAALRSVAGLAGVDGAIVMDGTPQLLAFGVVCNSFASQPTQVLRSTNAARPMEGEPADASEFGGSRHQSAINFCASHAPAAAVVASHDGGLTVFAAKAVGVVVGSRVSPIASAPEDHGPD